LIVKLLSIIYKEKLWDQTNPDIAQLT
jgi:hypothetical protein